MKSKFIKYIFMLSFISILGINVVNASSQIIDFSKKGSINVTLIESTNGTKVPSVEVTIYKVAKAEVENNNLIYKNLDELKSCNIDFSTIDDKNITTEMINCIESQDVYRQEAITNTEGVASFKNLDLALYLVVQTNKVEGYSSFNPFLVMIPQQNDNSWIYDVDTKPKTDIYKVININVKKVWNNEGKTNPKNVTIELLKDEEVISTVVLNDENMWNYTWHDIELSDKYSVREVDVPSEYDDSYRNDGYDFIVTNTRKLPQTGMRLWLVELLSIVGIIVLTIGYTMYKKYENN